MNPVPERLVIMQTNNHNKLIQVQNLSKSFLQKKTIVQALQNISFDIYQGDIFGIIGLSGAGKSTLVRCINFLEKPTEGTVIFDDKDLSLLNASGLNMARREMGMIFQQFNLLMQRTALENICFPLELAKTPKKDALKRAWELLELVGLTDRANAYPSQLSGGQKQRVAIARALATAPKVLLCDEATSALDPNTTNSVLELLKDINRTLNVTVVVITHEMSVVEKICNRVAIIDQSQIAEIGEVEDLFSNPKTAITKHLVYPERIQTNKHFGNNAVRIVFNGISSFEPIIANMIMEYKSPINIIFADTRNVDGKAMGQMIIQLPDDIITANKMRHFLDQQDVIVEEVDLNV